MDRNYYFKKLEFIYNKLDEIIHDASLSCNKCCICCLNLSEDTFTFIEASYIYEHTDNKYCSPEELFYNLRNSKICPFCDLENGKCTIYPFRSFICRRWGVFVEEVSSYIVKPCVYYGHTHIFPFEKRDTLPFTKEFYSLNDSFIKNLSMEEFLRMEKITASSFSQEEKLRMEIDDFTKAIELSFHKAPLLTLIGRAYMSMEDRDEAMNFYQKAIELEPEYDFAYYLQGLNFFGGNEFGKAEIYIKKALSINHHSVNIRAFLVMLYISMKKYEEAQKEIEYLSSFYPHILERYPFLSDIKYIIKQ